MSNLIDSRKIGKTIKSLRLNNHWTQDYLADIVGYSVRNLRRIENDGTVSLDIVNTLKKTRDFEVSFPLISGTLLLPRSETLLAGKLSRDLDTEAGVRRCINTLVRYGYESSDIYAALRRLRDSLE